MFVKADLTKAYDSVKWDYIMMIMKIMGFHNYWMQWIHRCMSTATIQSLIKCESRPLFSACNGIFHRHLITPYLFVIPMQGFTIMTGAAVKD